MSPLALWRRLDVRTRLVRYRSAVIVVAIVVGLSGGNLLWSARQQHGYQASVHRSHVLRVKGEQAVIDKLCLTFHRLSALKPPPGDPAKNPSRAYEQEQHDTLVQLGTDLGCQ